MSKPFRFKQFTVVQDHAPMKVGTDGVLLGAWAGYGEVDRVLDIGTGTGVMALQMAQRFPSAHIWAIEPHEMAIKDAGKNFEGSPFSDRLHLEQTILSAFSPDRIRFDLIICNPPFFPNGYALPDSGRAMARKAEFLSPRELASAIRLLRKGGRLAVIYPVDIFEEFSAEMSTTGWNLYRRADIRPTPRKEIHRTMGEFAEGIAQTQRSEIVIEEKGRHLYSEAYTALTRPFYLKLPDEIT